MSGQPFTLETCPDPGSHGNPFRYCPYCPWTEPVEPKTVDADERAALIRLGWVPPEEAEALRKAVNFWKTAAYDEEAERDWSAYAQDVSTQLMFAKARIAELEASWVPPEEAARVRSHSGGLAEALYDANVRSDAFEERAQWWEQTCDGWHADADKYLARAEFAKARIAELEASWVPPENVETIGTADMKDRLVSLDDGWVSLPPRLLLPHRVVVVLEAELRSAREADE